ncbi:hypothetical protein [Microcoleus sp. S13C4]|uniref:hypothetical protein n=1 Tax=Microcoleus sp. S13C4 TaxID=3055410 RepID=UPI002FD3CE61
MKFTVKDRQTLETIELNQLRNYLQTHGWHQDQPFLDNATLWHKPTTDGEELEILLPSRQNLRDYGARISQAIQTLENAENRPQIEILSELLTRIPNTIIKGIVMQIHTPNTKKLSGEITLLGLVIAKLRKIKTTLADKDYILAIKAYQERLPILCSGDLIKDNNAFILKNPHNLTLDELS